jgi:tetratricopeptide (TPR) repeat protein
MAKKNAIEKRLDILETLWNEFAEDEDARVLRWLVDKDEARMIEVFLAVQNEEGTMVPDLFVRLDAPFADSQLFGFELMKELREQYDGIREVLKQEQIAEDWVCPLPSPEESDVMAFVRACRSFREHYATIIQQHFVAVLFPKDMADPTAWQAWLWRLAKGDWPTHVRVMVIDSLQSPSLEPLAQEESIVVRTVRPELDMSGALAELAQDIPGHHPGNTFRRLLVALMNAAEKQDVATAERAATSAMTLAVKEGWPQMQIVVHMAMGATYLQAKNVDNALERYRQAHSVAIAAESADPMARKLRLQCRMAEGAVLISDGRYQEAAPVYEESAGLAEMIEDWLMTQECWRMAVYCYDRLTRWEEAWRCGQQALAAADKMEADQRKTSTLPFVGANLLRIAEQHVGTEHSDHVNNRMVAMLGPDWVDMTKAK